MVTIAPADESVILDPSGGTWHSTEKRPGISTCDVPAPTGEGPRADVTQRSPDFTLHTLAARLKERAQAGAEVSYTRKLLDRGVAHCAKKLGEEAVETVIAAIAEDRDRVIAETSDLLYHLLVVLEARGITLAEVEAALAQRTGKTGLEEKASRPPVT
jgi:phosphoribosyl-ATP pyrophosphohydrolase